jgi:DeoR/GlpR family transcriptional regulator of sugar metabolism
MASKMFREERLQLISERLGASRKVYVDELAQEFDVSPSSIRSDLAELEKRGLLKRTHGGAIVSTRQHSRMVTQKFSFELRKATEQAEKRAIGQAVASLIEDGDTLMIDGGSTTLHVARYLADKRNLTLITNAVSLLPDLMAIPDARIYVAGGWVEHRFETLLGDVTLEALEHFRTAKAILGIDGVSTQSGLSVTDPGVAAAKRKMMLLSHQVIIACDHTKLNQVCLIPIARLDEINILVTDAGAPAEFVEAVQKCGPRVVLAGMETTGAKNEAGDSWPQ